MSERPGGPTGLRSRRRFLEGLAVTIAQQAIVADAGQEDIDVAIGVEVGRGDAEAGEIVRQAERSRGILETAVPLVQEQGIVNAPRARRRPRPEEVELAVAVGVESGDGRAKTSANPADHGTEPVKSDGRDPPLAFGKL